MIYVCLSAIFVQASVWQVAGALVKLGRDGFLIFGVEASMVIGAMPAFTMGIVAGLYQLLILTVLVLVAFRRKRAMAVLLAAVALHLVIWVRVSFNPYVPAWPGLIIFTAEMVSVFMLNTLAIRTPVR
ncbi:MAG: hypothetical protein CMF75_07395 [Maricaulis sp.]|nr:hypothetical protein [Maricaulis sp.]